MSLPVFWDKRGEVRSASQSRSINRCTQWGVGRVASWRVQRFSFELGCRWRWRAFWFVSWEIQRSNLSEFLARFCAPRAGLFNQKLSVHFLESVAALGSTIWRKNVQKDYVAIATSCEEAPVVVFNDGRDARRCRCSELVDPEDVQVTIAMHPPGSTAVQ